MHNNNNETFTASCLTLGLSVIRLGTCKVNWRTEWIISGETVDGMEKSLGWKINFEEVSIELGTEYWLRICSVGIHYTVVVIFVIGVIRIKKTDSNYHEFRWPIVMKNSGIQLWYSIWFRMNRSYHYIRIVRWNTIHMQEFYSIDLK